MNAGRELDAIVAERVFRYTLDYEFAEITGAPNVKDLRDQYDEWGLLPHYSTDIGAAWSVCVRLNNDHANDAYERWVRFYEALLDKGPVLWGQSAEEAARLICECALEALGI